MKTDTIYWKLVNGNTNELKTQTNILNITCFKKSRAKNLPLTGPQPGL